VASVSLCYDYNALIEQRCAQRALTGMEASAQAEAGQMLH